MVGHGAVRALLLAALLGSACSDRRTNRPPPPMATATPTLAVPGPSSPPTAEPLPAPTAPPPPVQFQFGPPIRFRAGAALTAKLVARDAEALALSPDGRSYVLLLGQSARLITPTNPAGFEVPAAPSTLARFSADGALVAIHDSSITVLEVATGKKRLELEGLPSCALRFSPDGALLVHEEATAGNEWLGPLWRVSLTGGSPVALGPKRFTRQCEASPDGSAFIAIFPLPYALIDGRTGRSRELAIGAEAEVTVSPTADRVCTSRKMGDASDLACTRIADGGVEAVLFGASYPTIEFELGGRRALVERSVESRTAGITRELFLADFGTLRLHRVDGFEGKSGSIRRLMPGGALLAQGSSRGMMVYDLERGEKRFFAKARLYGASPMPGHPRRFFADAETFGGQDDAELYLVEMP